MARKLGAVWRRADPAALRVVAVVALSLAAAYVVWVVAVRPVDADAPRAPAAVPGLRLSESSLKALAASLGRPVFWAGRRPRTSYEVVRASRGELYVRYLPRARRARQDGRAVLTIATYPQPNALARLRAEARQRGLTTVRLRGGGLAVFDPRVPTNVYLARPRSGFQIEVYDPSPGIARRLVVSGRVTPL